MQLQNINFISCKVPNIYYMYSSMFMFNIFFTKDFLYMYRKIPAEFCHIEHGSTFKKAV